MSDDSAEPAIETSGGEVTRLLREWREGSPRAQEELFEVVYDELRRLARAHLRRERAGHTLPPTGLVHEAFLRLQREGALVGQPENRQHFFALAARAMRRILVEHARYHSAARRPSSRDAQPLDENLRSGTDPRVLTEILAVDEALGRLRAANERQAKVVELRYFAGLDESEVAELLEVSRSTVSRDWRVARLMLQRILSSGEPDVAGR